ncbi:MAG: ABC transporter ATP-binding protein/permease [Clostridia bacterium]|nr:ABC transporter ATP-binding protein/permease [Clostridia bacterium]
MLELQNIRKDYETGSETVRALKGITLTFRKNEYVSILGPSGCGKTTLLNLVGGLDRYTSGDLIINGRSTKEYRDRDWDSYRNHSIGFVFQSYNLIPHQTVLQNVELALTLTGVSKKERRKKATEALERVGLGSQLRKKPNQLSGGQMQRVAIARAIVNDPDIILADEPTGALDSETSVQVLGILKEIAADRLVIMVTHNSELAERYSTRIITMLDGVITGDSNPLTEDEYRKESADCDETKPSRKQKRPSMSPVTSFGLSLKNLFTKKGRTALTSFAGSIGIIGIALIYSVSYGTTAYINSVQEETLSSYPLTIEAQTVDISSLLETYSGRGESSSEHENDAVYEKGTLYEMVNALSALESRDNDLASFKTYLDEQRAQPGSVLSESVSAVQYTYDANLLIFTETADGKIIQSDSEALMVELIRKYMGTDLGTVGNQSMMGSSLMSSSRKIWRELLSGENGSLISPVTLKQYDLVYGSWPARFDEIVLMLGDDNELSDLTLYALGLKSQEEIDALMDAAVHQESVEYETKKWTYEEICDKSFRMVLAGNCFVLDEKTGLYSDLRDSEPGKKYLYDNGTDLHVVGIVRPNEDAVSPSGSGFIGYTYKLTVKILEDAYRTEAAKAQLADPSTDIFSGLPFQNGRNLKTDEKAEAFRSHAESLDTGRQAELYVKIKSLPPKEWVQEKTDTALADMTREQIEQSLSRIVGMQMKMDEAAVLEYLASMTEEDLLSLYRGYLEQQFTAQFAAGVFSELRDVSPEQLAAALNEEIVSYSDEKCAELYESVLDFAKTSYEENLILLGCADQNSPSTISLYASSFAQKDRMLQAIASYNDSVEELKQIRYVDYVGILMSSVTTIIDAISYVLIAFVSVSLIVSSIMIGVITLISVQERTKEIGILRAIGASKKNVSNLFNAETVLIGFASGVLGILITELLILVINRILHALTGIHTLNAALPVGVAGLLILISMILTLFAGIIPSRSAARKDPVVALRTE